MKTKPSESGQTLLEATFALSLVALALLVSAKLCGLLWFHLHARFLLRENLVCEIASRHTAKICTEQLNQKLRNLAPQNSLKTTHSRAKQSIKLTGSMSNIKYNFTEKYDGP